MSEPGGSLHLGRVRGTLALRFGSRYGAAQGESMRVLVAKLMTGLAVAVWMLAGTASVQAQDRSASWDVSRAGPYFGIRAIGSIANLEDTETTGFTGPTLVENDSDEVAGPAFVGGWVFHNFPLRAEIEAGYRVRFDYDVRDLAPGGTIDYEMDVATTQVLVNMILEWRNSSSFTPFVGGTVGWARNHMEIQRSNLATGAQTTPDNDQDNIALGGMAGINWRFADSWSTDLIYRYINLGPVESGVIPGTGETIEADGYHSHDVLWSVYYHF